MIRKQGSTARGSSTTSSPFPAPQTDSPRDSGSDPLRTRPTITLCTQHRLRGPTPPLSVAPPLPAKVLSPRLERRWLVDPAPPGRRRSSGSAIISLRRRRTGRRWRRRGRGPRIGTPRSGDVRVGLWTRKTSRSGPGHAAARGPAGSEDYLDDAAGGWAEGSSAGAENDGVGPRGGGWDGVLGWCWVWAWACTWVWLGLGVMEWGDDEWVRLQGVFWGGGRRRRGEFGLNRRRSRPGLEPSWVWGRRRRRPKRWTCIGGI
ncbi:uncharacterized protein A4U43_C10F150 [Asparagus officinalis]|uniref:Uncharacterized protein n=1 Tax=Asparagus officinalis TaxID=4686 RepID=A0A5P1DZH2_ASPOF|nr:uncharacterized protein A4U43_C10F150 [Asparagus officinalis]